MVQACLRAAACENVLRTKFSERELLTALGPKFDLYEKNLSLFCRATSDRLRLTKVLLTVAKTFFEIIPSLLTLM